MLTYVNMTQGWTKRYDFSYADLKAATDLVERLGGQAGGVPLDVLRGLLTDAVYGSRVDTRADQQVRR